MCVCVCVCVLTFINTRTSTLGGWVVEGLSMFQTSHFITFQRPLDLELTVIQEMVVMENLNVFSANGFEFQIDKEGMLG